MTIAITLAVFAGSARAEKPLANHSFIRGVNHRITDDPGILERDLGYAKRVNLNSMRVWLSYPAYEKDPAGCLERRRNYIRHSQRLGFSTTPILWNGNNLNPDTLKPAFRPRAEAYVKAIVEAIKNEPGLLRWDIMNEPFTNDYYDNSPEPEKKQWEAEITAFVRRQLSYVKQLDPVNATTVGYTLASQLEPTADLVDVLSFHDYTSLRSTIEPAYATAEAVAKKFGKPMLNTGTGCIARGNPYDLGLEIAGRHRTGWYLFNLIIQG